MFKSHLFRLTALLAILIIIGMLVTGCVAYVAKSASDNFLDSYEQGNDNTQILQDVVTGLESDVENRAMNVASSLGEAAGKIAGKIGNGIGDALGKIASGNFVLSDAVDGIVGAGRDFARQSADFVSEKAQQTKEDISNSVDRYSEIINDHKAEIEADNSSFLSNDELFGPFKVNYVCDGDTFHLLLSEEDCDDLEIDANSDPRWRLIGIDTPESVHADESRICKEGKIASDYTKELLKGEYVYIRYDVQHEDQYGRQLIYCYLDRPGYPMLQDILLSEGYARCMTIQPNVEYSEHFADLQHQAAINQKGFWANYYSEE